MDKIKTFRELAKVSEEASEWYDSGEAEEWLKANDGLDFDKQCFPPWYKKLRKILNEAEVKIS